MQGNQPVQSNDGPAPAAILDAAVEAAQAAAAVIRKGASEAGNLDWERKGASDFVTEVDRAAESIVADAIARHFPDAKIVGEELSPGAPPSAPGLTFVVDPLDGTTNFLHGYPQYAVSIAAVRNSSLIAGIVLNVTTSECFTAIAGSGARLNGREISVSREKDPSRALVGTGFPFKNPDLLDTYARQFVAVSRGTAGIRRAGSAALDLADVACGRFDAFWELDLAPWDIAAGILLVREAGGLVTAWDGSFRDISAGPVVAGNPDIHPWLLRTLHASDTSSPQ